MRNGRAPTATAPADGCIRAGPKSGSRPRWSISALRPSYWPRRTSASLTRSGRVGRLGVEVDRAGRSGRRSARPNARASSTQSSIVVSPSGHERDDVDGADPRVLAGVQRPCRSRGSAAATSRSRASVTALVLAGQREHGPVVAGVARPVEQGDARDRRRWRPRAGRRRRAGGPRRRSGRTRSAPDDASRPATGTCARSVTARRDARTATVDSPRRDRSPTRSLLRHADFLKLWTARDHQPVRDAGQPARDPAGRGDAPERHAVRGRPARHDRVPAVHPVQPAGGRLGRPPAPPADPHRRRPRPGVDARCPSRSRYAFDVLTIWQLYVVGFVNGIADRVLRRRLPCRYLPSLVERDQLVEGNSKLEITRTAGPDPRARPSAVASSAADRRRSRSSSTPSATSSRRCSCSSSGGTEPTPDRHVDEHGQAREPAMREEVADRPALRASATATCAPSPRPPGRRTCSATSPSRSFIVYARPRAAASTPSDDRHRLRRRQRRGRCSARSPANRWSQRFGVGPTIVGSMAFTAPGRSCSSRSRRPRRRSRSSSRPSGSSAASASVVYNINQVELPPGDHARARCRAG